MTIYIWQPRRKYRNNYSEAQLDTAVLKVRSEEMSLTQAAMYFGIPRSTIQSRVDISRACTIVKKRREKSTNIVLSKNKRYPYLEEELDAAVLKVRNQEMGLTKAAKLFGIPVSTVQSRLHKLIKTRLDEEVPTVPVSLPVTMIKSEPLEVTTANFPDTSSCN